MDRLPISVCIIAGNEAARIRATLDSVAGWTGEIIVVLNDNVQDGTDQIAAGYGAKIFREPWKGHIAQKNSAAEKATQPWILGLDADEVVSPRLRTEMQNLFSAPNRTGDRVAFSFPRCSFYLGRWIRHGDWYPDRKIRLWQRGHAKWGGENPHDTVLVTGPVGRLHGDLLHYSMESLNHHVNKLVVYSDIYVRRQEARGRNVGFFQLCFRPWWRFVRGYFLRRGFLDGWQGLVIARMVATETFLRLAKLREARQGRDGATPSTP